MCEKLAGTARGFVHDLAHDLVEEEGGRTSARARRLDRV